MARFPKRKAQIAAPSERLYRGLLSNTTTAQSTKISIALNKAGDRPESNTVEMVLCFF